MKKLFTLAAAVLASVCLMAETVTMDLALAKGSTPSPSIGVALMSGGAFDGNGYKLGSDGNYIGWNIAAAERTFSAVTFNGYINTTNTEKNWGFQFSTDGGTTWGNELLQANDGTKSYHDIAVTVDIPSGANAIRIIRRAGTSAYVRSITLTLADDTPASDPVTSITVNGPEAGYIGLPVTLTAKPDVKADTIWWTDQYGTKQESKNGVFTFTPSAAGSYTYTAWAENAHNENPVTKEHSVTVTKLCGDLIHATLTDGTHATVTGVVGGTADAALSSNRKMDKGKYFGLTLSNGTFMAGDVVTIVMSAAGQNYPCLFGDKDRKILLFLATETSSELTYEIVLPAAANGLKSIYISRDGDDATYKWNPTVLEMYVTRSCEESDNNNASVTINGEAAEKSGTVFNYTLSNSYADPTVDVVITLEHPLATLMEDHAASFTMPTPEVGTPSVETFKVKAENGDQAWYSIFVNKAASLNDDATLSALSVEGYTLTPAFDAETTAYTITKAYKAANPDESKVSATPNDANANAVVVLEGDVFTITVTAEDNTTTKVYTITILEADAKKDLLQVTFSNGVHGYILNGNIQVPYLAGEEEPTFVSAEFWNPDGEPTAEVVDDKLVVTGADSKTAEYSFEFVELTPMGLTYNLVTFTEVPSYIFSVYGWDSSKGVKFSKDVEEASNRRISEGKDRIYIALPAAQSVTLTSGTSERPVRITLNGEVLIEKKNTPATGKTFTIQLDQSNHNLLGFESNGNNGDAGFVSLQLNEAWPTGMDNTDADNKAIKTIENGQIVIIKNGVRYNVLGAVLK